jgi:hypothetical protein
MNPKAKEEHEDSRTTSHYHLDMNSPKGNQAEES